MSFSHFASLQCDGVSYTETLKRRSIEAVAFLNIGSYAAGTNPWGTRSALPGEKFDAPSICDGKLEVCCIVSVADHDDVDVGHVRQSGLDDAYYVSCFLF